MSPLFSREMAAHRFNISLDEVGNTALLRIPRYERSQVIRDLLIDRDPEAIESVHLKVKLAILDDKLQWTSALLAIAREMEVLEEDEGTLDAPRAERLHALALKACLLKQEVPCKATQQTLRRILVLYSDFVGEKIGVKDIEKELSGFFKNPIHESKVPSERKGKPKLEARS